MKTLQIFGTLVALSLATTAVGQQTTDAVNPEGVGAGQTFAVSEAAQASLAAKAAGKPVLARNWMIVAANPLAVDAGATVLASGGSAADAMVAVQAVLGLVEPQSSGLGGGAFLVWYDAESRSVTTLDGRETAPAAATPRLFQTADGEPLKFWDAVVGGRSVGTPGTPALMEAAHSRWGKLPWSGLFDDAIALAENGFTVSERLAMLVEGRAGTPRTFLPPQPTIFCPAGCRSKAGDRLVNSAYAGTLRTMASDGSPVPSMPVRLRMRIVAAVAGAEGNPGFLSRADLAGYQSQRASGRMPALSRNPGMRDGTAVVGRTDGRADSWHARKF